MGTKACKTGPTCTETLSDKSRFEHCTNCRIGISRWSDRPTHEVLERQNQLIKLENRMSFVKTKDNVTSILASKKLKLKRLKRRGYNGRR